MSFDIEKRFRFVSSDDINDDVNESDYQANDEIVTGIEEEEKGLKQKKETKESEFDNEDKDKENDPNDLEDLEDEDDDEEDD